MIISSPYILRFRSFKNVRFCQGKKYRVTVFQSNEIFENRKMRISGYDFWPTMPEMKNLQYSKCGKELFRILKYAYIDKDSQQKQIIFRAL